MLKIKIIDLKNQDLGQLEVVNKSFDIQKTNNQVIFDKVIAELANKRQGTHSTLTKAEVRGGGKKPVAQKHTGRARQGSIRNPHYVGGGVVFGPKPTRNYKIKINKKVAHLAFINVLANKIKTDSVVILKDQFSANKTKDYAKFIKLLKLVDKPLLFSFCSKHIVIAKYLKNINNVVVKNIKQISVFDLLKAKKVFCCEDGIKQLIGDDK